MTNNDELSGQDDYGQAESDYNYTTPSYSYNEYLESLQKRHPDLSNSNIEKPPKDIKSNGSYSQKMDSSEQICIDIDNGANKTGEITESTSDMGMDVPIDLVEQFKALSQEKQERAISYIADFEAKAKPSALDKLKKGYTKFPENQKTTVDAVLAHLKLQLKDYVVIFGAKEDSIYLDDLRKVEPLTTKMYQAFYRAHKRDNSKPLLSDLIPKKTEKVTKRLESFKITKQTTLKEYHQFKAIIHKRTKSSNHLPIPETA